MFCTEIVCHNGGHKVDSVHCHCHDTNWAPPSCRLCKDNRVDPQCTQHPDWQNGSLIHDQFLHVHRPPVRGSLWSFIVAFVWIGVLIVMAGSLAVHTVSATTDR